MDPNDKWLNSQRYQWWGAPQHFADKNDDANSTKKDNKRTKEDERKENKEVEKQARGVDGEKKEEEIDKDARKKARKKEEGERLVRMFENELGLRKRR